MALAQLSAYLAQQGFESEIMDINIALYHRHHRPGSNGWSDAIETVWDHDALASEFLKQEKAWIFAQYLERICRHERPVVGFSVNSSSIPSSLIVAGWLKAVRADVVVVFGGQIFNTLPNWADVVIRKPQVDAVIAGDGEHTLADLLDRLRQGASLEGCRGMYIRDAEGEPVYTGARPPVDLDELPFADFSSFDMELYGSDHAKPHDLVMMTNRGCVRRCSFCGHRTAWPGFRQMSGERIYAEIQHQRKVLPSLRHSDSEIKFYDLLINGDMKKLMRLCDLLISDSGPRLSWRECNAIIRPEMTEDACRRLYEAGCRMLIIGLESGSQRVLDIMEKGQTVEQMKAVLKNIDRAGLMTRGNFMFGHPGETEDDFRATLDFIREMHPYIHHVYPSFTFTNLEGRLLEDPRAWGVVPGPHALYWESADKTNTYPVRLERYRAFRQLALSLGMNVGDGLEMSVEAYTQFSLGRYHDGIGQLDKAIEHYGRYLAEDPQNEYVLKRLAEIKQAPVSRA